jgi:cellulose synthase/poly-beta-1,6-N-acetylglucosamine synthase-like glycosyltransferase
MVVVDIFSVTLFVYLAASTLYLLLMAMAAKWGRLPLYQNHPHKNKIAVIIPSYKEDAIIIDTATKATAHNYPTNGFTVFVVADSLQPATIAQLKQIPVQVMEVAVSMKSKSIHALLQTLPEDNFQIAMILDADNVMVDDCLEKVNDAFNKNVLAMQCHRQGKNQQTPVALLDAISEAININFFRRGPAVLGVSAAPMGSGMAFQFSLLKEIASQPAVLSSAGEDREIDLYLLKQGINMQFIDDAIVLDEKVTNTQVFEKQRIRWLEAQFNHLKKLLQKEMKPVFTTRVYVHKLFQNMILPRSLLMVVFACIGCLLLLQYFLPYSILQPPLLWWCCAMIGYGCTLVLAIPARYYTTATLKALLHIPVLILSMLKALLKVKPRRKEFLHTVKHFKAKD